MAARPLLRYAKADDCRAAGCLPRCLLEHRPPEASRIAASGRSTRLAAAPARPASSARSSAASTTSTRARENARLRDHAWCLAFPVHPPFAGLVERTPTAAIAGPLIIVGVRLLKPAHIETARRNGDFAAYLATALGVVLPNLLHGVGDPLALAIGLTGWRVIRAPGGMVHITGSLIRLDLARPVAAPVATAATSAPPTVMTMLPKSDAAGDITGAANRGRTGCRRAAAVRVSAPPTDSSTHSAQRLPRPAARAGPARF
jgi:hypothetical protein